MKGFTLIELILVIAITAIVAALSVPFVQSFQTSTDLYTHANTITKTLRRVQQQSIVGQNDSSWGVYFDNGIKSLIVFKGDNYISRDPDFDQPIEYPAVFNLTTDFGNEFYFSIYSGQPSASGLITLDGLNNESKTISITSFGLIQID